MNVKYLLLSLLVAASHGFAAQQPFTQGGDSRVKQVAYKSNEVVVINAKAGVVTDIILESDEVYLTHAFGDSEAWHFNTYGNHVFIKPKLRNGDTNLTLLTNKRTYNFVIKYTDVEVFQVKFNYPDTALKNAQEDIKTKLLDDAWKGKPYNLSYDMKGDAAVAPINVWDDGTFTYFKFAGNVDLPAIYAILKSEDGNEAIVNRTVQGESNNIIKMHKVNPMWRLRLGGSVLNVYNRVMNWKGVENKTGTVSGSVDRDVIGGDENE